MEKKRKSFTMGTKRQRKTSLRKAVSEPKNIILDISEIPPIQLDNALNADSEKHKLTKGNIPVSDNEIEATPSKKKENVENGNVSEAKKSKKRKRHSDKATKGGIIAIKKKKQEALMEEVQKLKAELDVEDALKLIKDNVSKDTSQQKTPFAKLVCNDFNIEEAGDKYPILKNKELIDRFLKVPMSNNQKGRIRQSVKLTLQGTTTKMFPDIINGKIQAILKSSTDLTDSDLRRVRILYNMLKTALEAPDELEEVEPPKKKKKDKKKRKDGGEEKRDEGKKDELNKPKGPKRYVVFLGNLPLNVDKEKIMDHFRELNEHILDIRLPKQAEGAKSAIAYVELTNEPSYELALSKHHSMLGTRRIRVLYTTQKNGKVSKAQAKSKSAKLIALQKAGKLIGSVPKTKKRSHRRAIMKKAKALEAAAE